MIRLVIEYDPQKGAVNVTGPLQDKIACLGLLEWAKKVVTDYQGPQIEAARPVDILLENLARN